MDEAVHHAVHDRLAVLTDDLAVLNRRAVRARLVWDVTAAAVALAFLAVTGVWLLAREWLSAACTFAFAATTLAYNWRVRLLMMTNAALTERTLLWAWLADERQP
jgi:hypothetical protein